MEPCKEEYFQGSNLTRQIYDELAVTLKSPPYCIKDMKKVNLKNFEITPKDNK